MRPEADHGHRIPAAGAAALFRLAAGSDDALPSVQLAGRIADYEIEGELGRGGMGIVYRAREVSTGRPVALKVVLEALDPTQLERFQREGQLTASLRHPGIVRVHAAGVADGRPFLAYELVQGESFEAVLERVERREAVELLRDVARALGAAHAQGIVHRDVKPENVLVDVDGRVRVADFGIALSENLERLTQTGGVVGTPMFMAPETVFGERDQVGPACDVWALGVLLYRVLTGSYPYSTLTLSHILVRLASNQPPPAPRSLDSSVSPQLNAICLRCLDPDPSRRPADGESLARELDRALELPVTVRGTGALAFALLGACTLLVAALAALWGAQRSRPEPPTTPRNARTAPPKAAPREAPPASPSTRDPLQGLLEPRPDPYPAAYVGETLVFTAVREAADSNDDADSTWRVGQLLEDGQGVEPDAEEALWWYRRAARESPPHMARLGERLLGTPRDAEGRAWLELAGEQGVLRAYVTLAGALEDRLAIDYLRRAADGKSPVGLYALGERYDRGQGVPQDRARALDLFQKAADLGHPWGLAEVANELRARDPARAADLYRQAVDRGNLHAAVPLGEMLRDGEGIAQDLKQAYELFHRAAQEGIPVGMRALAAMLRDGRGCQADPKQAAKWLARAAEAQR